MSSASLLFRSRRPLLRGLSLTACLLLAGVSQARAQAPFLYLGIYGGVPTVSATAATVAITAVRPMDENKPFRANISMSSLAAWPGRPHVANHSEPTAEPI